MAGVDEPPGSITYTLEEALTLLAALEDANDALMQGGYLTVVVSIEAEIQLLNRKLRFDDSDGGADG